MSKGIVIFGINNAKVEYVQLAIICAAFIRKNMPGTNICLITDKESKAYQDGKAGLSTESFFDDIVIMPEETYRFENKRRYRDTQYYGFDEHFKNEGRASVYDLSPYDETLLVDCDYLICNNVLSHVWGCSEDLMINKAAIDLSHSSLAGDEFRLNAFGIPMYWATIIYFRKGPKAKLLFSLVDHIKENWEFYKLTYDFPGTLFRNDYAFSIALHILNGFNEGNDFATDLPDPVILTAPDTDQFYGISSPTELHMFRQDKKDTWKFLGVKLKGLSVHCMNKLSLLNHTDAIMEVLE